MDESIQAPRARTAGGAKASRARAAGILALVGILQTFAMSVFEPPSFEAPQQWLLVIASAVVVAAARKPDKAAVVQSVLAAYLLFLPLAALSGQAWPIPWREACLRVPQGIAVLPVFAAAFLLQGPRPAGQSAEGPGLAWGWALAGILILAQAAFVGPLLGFRYGHGYEAGLALLGRFAFLAAAMLMLHQPLKAPLLRAAVGACSLVFHIVRLCA